MKAKSILIIATSVVNAVLGAGVLLAMSFENPSSRDFVLKALAWTMIVGAALLAIVGSFAVGRAQGTEAKTTSSAAEDQQR